MFFPVRIVARVIVTCFVVTTFALATLVVDAGASSAQTGGTGADRKRATELYERSRVLYRDGNFAEAAGLLEEAYGLHPFPALLYNLARAREGLGEREAAARAYERYLEADPKVEDRKSIEARIASLRRAEATKLAPTSTAASNPPPSAPPAEEAPSLLEGPFPWILAGTGGVITAAGAVLLGVAFSMNADADDETTQIAAADGRADAERVHVASIVTMSVGGAVAGVGIVLGIAGATSATNERGGTVVGLSTRLDF